jgi:uncharacterized protein
MTGGAGGAYERGPEREVAGMDQPSGGPPTYKGRIFGRHVLEATFRSFFGVDLYLGELLVAEDPERARRFLFRVIQVTYGSDSSDPGWAERTAGQFMAGDVAGASYGLRDPEQRLYKIATCQPLGSIDAAGGFHKPKSLPAQFARVTAPGPDDVAFLADRMGDLRIGLLRSGEETIDLEVGIRGDTLTSHVGVFATTGMGKSNLMKVLAGQVLGSQGRYAILLFDPHGEYLEGGSGLRRGLRDHPWAADRLKVYATRSAGAGATALRLSLGELTLGDLQTARSSSPWPRARCRSSSAEPNGSWRCRASPAIRRSPRCRRASSRSSRRATRCWSTRRDCPRPRRSSSRR